MDDARFWVVTAVFGLAACGSVTSQNNLDAGPDAAVDAVLDGASDGPTDSASDARPDDGGAPVALSCVGLPSTCGAASDDSCCTSLAVAGSTYHRSFDVVGDTYSGTTSFPATVSDFELDKYEVTVARFRAFVNAGMGTQASPPAVGTGAHAKITGSGWEASWNASLLANRAALLAAVKCDASLQTWTEQSAGNEKRPMNCVSWYEAMAFCIWDGGFLPTEAEWNYAATGGSQQRAYPWSSPADSVTIDRDHASYDDGTGCAGDGLPPCTVEDLVPVGSKPSGNGRWGHSDMAGNVIEWALDWAAVYSSTCTDCANLVPGASREIRGGNFSGDMNNVRTGVRAALPPGMRNAITGLRCARPAH